MCFRGVELNKVAVCVWFNVSVLKCFMGSKTWKNQSKFQESQLSWTCQNISWPVLPESWKKKDSRRFSSNNGILRLNTLIQKTNNCKIFFLILGISYFLNVWIFESLNFWISGFLDFRISGSLDFLIFTLDFRISGFLDLWIF